MLLRKSIDLTSEERNKHFDTLRKNYGKRRELNNFVVSIKNENNRLKKLLSVLRVKVI
jgi:hypothetical protein